MFKSLFDSISEKVFGRKPKVVPAVTEAPYKVEPQPPVVEPSPVTVVAPEPVVAPAPEPMSSAVPAAKKTRTKTKDEKLKVEVNKSLEEGKAAPKKAKTHPPKPKESVSKLKVVSADTGTAKKKTNKQK